MTENICKYCKHYQKEYVATSKQVAYLVKEKCKEGENIEIDSVKCDFFDKKLSHRIKEFLWGWW
jgi:hypothetical protein